MKQTPFSINIIGSGNVAWQLGVALNKSKNIVKAVYSRNNTEGKKLAKKLKAIFIDDIKKLPESDITIIAVSDNAIKSVSGRLPVKRKQLILHTSGSISLDALTKHPVRGVLYPLQTIKKDIKTNFQNVSLFVEGNNNTSITLVKQLAYKLSPTVFHFDSDKRKAMHIAAVFACNFTNHLYSISEEILNNEGIKLNILFPLIKETAMRVKKKSPKENQTGPAFRKDYIVMNEHLAYLKEKPEYKKLYKLLSESIMKK